MGNLTEYYKKFTHREKLEIICAWELFYGQRHSVGVVPFLDKDKVEQSLLKRLAEGPNFDGVGGVLRKLGALVSKIETEDVVDDVVMSDGERRKILLGTSVTITVERYNEEGVRDVQTLVYTNP